MVQPERLFVSRCPCEGHATCPGCPPPRSQWLQEVETTSTFPVKLKVGKENKSLDGWACFQNSLFLRLNVVLEPGWKMKPTTDWDWATFCCRLKNLRAKGKKAESSVKSWWSVKLHVHALRSNRSGRLRVTSFTCMRLMLTQSSQATIITHPGAIMFLAMGMHVLVK